MIENLLDIKINMKNLPKNICFELTLINRQRVKIAIVDKRNNDILDCDFCKAENITKDKLESWIDMFRTSLIDHGVIN